MFKVLSANSLEKVQNFWVEAQNFRGSPKVLGGS